MRIDSSQYDGICSCGKAHKIDTKLCAIEPGCLKELDTYLKEQGLCGITAAVYDENTYEATKDRHPIVDYEIVLSPDNLHANEDGVSLLSKRLPEKIDVLIAIGSGTIHDITRYCAYTKEADFVSCPTAASVDGFCSSVAAMTWNGCKKTLTAVAPKLVVADTDIFMNAPIRLTRSGFGDMIGKYVALTDWKIANILKDEFYCERIANIMSEATKSVLESVDGIIEGEAQAYEMLMYGLLLSGLAMQMMGNSRPASGAEHHISHFIEMSPPAYSLNSDALHGEKVGVGTLLAIREYKRIASSDIKFKDYTKTDEDTVIHIFGEKMASDIANENRCDSASGISAELLKSCFSKISDEINKTPSIDELSGIFSKINADSRLCDIGVDENLEEILLKYSPLVRNRLTLMRLRNAIKTN